ncbi:MAG: sulfatase-like hydrolase/transferase [Bacteroidetes bacterium]|nr:sulfatase-like hydrolase/transferase [Bacteroidota bacterium]
MKNKLSRGILIITAGLLLFAGCTDETESELPNFVVFLTDDLGYGELSCYGHPINKTPNLDRLAEQGVLLTDCHSAGTVCSPSRAGLLTGRHPYRSGFYYIARGGKYLRDWEITIPELLKQKGYQSAFIGKWHLSKLENPDEPDPGDQGFDYWLASSGNGKPGPRNPENMILNGQALDVVEGWYCDVVVSESIKWLKTVDIGKPFYLEICTHEPHTRIDPPDSLTAEFFDPDLMDKISGLKFGGISHSITDTLLGAAKYFATVKQIDNAFGVLMKELERLDLDDNTLVLFTSDNGPEEPHNAFEGEWVKAYQSCFGTPGELKGLKRYTYEGGHRVPGIVRWPGKIPAGTISDKLFNATDILPTICSLAEVELPGDRAIDGEDMFEAFLNKPTFRKDPVLWAFPHWEDWWKEMPHIAMRTDSLVLMAWLPPMKEDDEDIEWLKSSIPERFELYNIYKDPGQRNDIFSSDEEITERLINELIKEWIEIRDEFKVDDGLR